MGKGAERRNPAQRAGASAFRGRVLRLFRRYSSRTRVRSRSAELFPGVAEVKLFPHHRKKRDGRTVEAERDAVLVDPYDRTGDTHFTTVPHGEAAGDPHALGRRNAG